jgi:hypothetical protein
VGGHVMRQELVIDLFDESAPENEALARLVDEARWQELISKYQQESKKVLSPQEWKDFVKEQDSGIRAMNPSQFRDFVAEQEGGPTDPLAALVAELIEG